MNWIALSILTTFAEASKDILSKLSLYKTNAYIVAWAYRLYALPFLLLSLIWIEIPDISPSFWYALILGGCLNVISGILYMKAIEQSELSLTVPLVAFTPIFLLLSSPIMLNEYPNSAGIIGVSLIVVGSYFLNFKSIKTNGVWAPFKALVKQKGSRLMLLVAFIWSITSPFDKIGIQSSSPLFWALSANTFIAIAMAPIVLIKAKAQVKQLSSNFSLLIPIGLAGASTLVFQMLAVSLTNVAYVISVKRTSSILVVIAGYLILKEGSVANRLLGAILMVAGVIIIAIFN